MEVESPMTESQALRTLAWLLMGLTGSAPGVLALDGDRLSFVAHGRGALTEGQVRELEGRSGRVGLADRLDGDHIETVFDTPRGHVHAVSFPWYYFGGGVRFTVGDVGFRFSFLQPQNTTLPRGHAAVTDLAGIPAGRSVGRAWRAALTR